MSFVVTIISVTQNAEASALINKNTAQRVNVTNILSAGFQSGSGYQVRILLFAKVKEVSL
jgi:hypothetical protein